MTHHGCNGLVEVFSLYRCVRPPIQLDTPLQNIVGASLWYKGSTTATYRGPRRVLVELRGEEGLESLLHTVKITRTRTLEGIHAKRVPVQRAESHTQQSASRN